jgi:hypothetical protein
MSEFTSEGPQAADEEVAYVESEPNDDPLTVPGEAAESGPQSGPTDEMADDEADRKD